VGALVRIHVFTMVMAVVKSVEVGRTCETAAYYRNRQCRATGVVAGSHRGPSCLEKHPNGENHDDETGYEHEQRLRIVSDDLIASSQDRDRQYPNNRRMGDHRAQAKEVGLRDFYAHCDDKRRDHRLGVSRLQSVESAKEQRLKKNSQARPVPC
jgi:hypothetical protein